jgi:hypothetical protein
MKTLTIQIDNSLYDALLEILKNLPKSKIIIQEENTEMEGLDFDKAMDYALHKNKELYERLA